jgi:hypothetical protein
LAPENLKLDIEVPIKSNPGSRMQVKSDHHMSLTLRNNGSIQESRTALSTANQTLKGSSQNNFASTKSTIGGSGAGLLLFKKKSNKMFVIDPRKNRVRVMSATTAPK